MEQGVSPRLRNACRLSRKLSFFKQSTIELAICSFERT